jgi:pimeloyl-ACP methyl ester carboxylesterase
MADERIHRAVSDDGTGIAGRVYGSGPPLVLVHGAASDGEVEWAPAVPLLAERFTCYLLDGRCRGLSDASDDLSPERLVEDITAFVDSIGVPVRLAGASGGGMYVLGAAARSAAVAAVAVWEPVVLETISEQLAESFQEVLERMRTDVVAGRHVDAAATFLSLVGTDAEMAALAASGELAKASRYAAVDLREVEQATTSEGPTPTDPSVLTKITAPVLLLLGGESKQRDWFRAGAAFAAEHLADARVREIAGVGHLTHQVTPQPLARELLDFFTSTPQRV